MTHLQSFQRANADKKRIESARCTARVARHYCDVVQEQAERARRSAEIAEAFLAAIVADLGN